MGPPGAGKGTQGMLLAERYAVPHIASGEILRRLIATEDSELARAARVINEGKLIPDAVANAIAFREMEKPGAARGFILDGYPRDVAQAEALEGFLAARGQALDASVALLAGEDVLVERLTGRLTCPVCETSYHARSDPPRAPGVCDREGAALVVREDDHPDRIRIRIALYHQKTEPLVAFYRERGLLREVDAVGTEAEVCRAIERALVG